MGSGRRQGLLSMKDISSNLRAKARLISCGALALFLAGCSGSHPPSVTSTPPPENPIGPNLTKMSSDPYTTAIGQHATEVEPHMVAFGNTLVAAFQTGRLGATQLVRR